MDQVCKPGMWLPIFHSGSLVKSVRAAAAGTICLMLLLTFAATVITAQTTAPTNNGWVVLPVSDYAALRLAAFPPDAEPVAPPVDATLSRIDYALKVDGDLALGEARLTVDVIKDGWVKLAMPEGLMVREAQLDGRLVTLAPNSSGKGQNRMELLLSKTGRSVLTLKIVAPVTTTAGTDILRLPVSNSAVSQADVELNRQGVDVTISGGLLLKHEDTPKGSRWVANGRGNEPLTFAWRRRVDENRSSQPLRFRSVVTQVIGLGEDVTQLSAEVQLQVLQGVASEIIVRLPEQFAVNQVAGAMVADWDVQNHQLKVIFIEPVPDTSRFIVIGEVRLARTGKLEIPLVRVPAAERETGGVAVEVLGAGEIKERLTTGLDEAEAADLGPLISSRQSPSLVAFRLHPAEGKTERSLTLNVARYTPQAVLTANIEEAAYSALLTADGKILVQSRFAVRNNQRNFLKVTLPPTATLWSASISGRQIRPGRAPDGSLLLPLEKTRTGDESPAFVVEISYFDRSGVWTDKMHARLALAAVDLPISKSRLLFYHPPLFRPASSGVIAGSFRVATYEPPESSSLRSTITTTNPTESYESGRDESPETKLLLSRLRDSKSATKPARTLPVRVNFPHFGPSIFLVSELTSENQTPFLEMDFQRDKKRGGR